MNERIFMLVQENEHAHRCKRGLSARLPNIPPLKAYGYGPM